MEVSKKWNNILFAKGLSTQNSIACKNSSEMKVKFKKAILQMYMATETLV